MRNLIRPLIWKSGSAYMPIDAEFPPERISFLLRDSEASLLVTTH
jgi:fengycin family lipopeptide synthetase B